MIKKLIIMITLPCMAIGGDNTVYPIKSTRAQAYNDYTRKLYARLVAAQNKYEFAKDAVHAVSSTKKEGKVQEYLYQKAQENLHWQEEKLEWEERNWRLGVRMQSCLDKNSLAYQQCYDQVCKSIQPSFMDNAYEQFLGDPVKAYQRHTDTVNALGTVREQLQRAAQEAEREKIESALEYQVNHKSVKNLTSISRLASKDPEVRTFWEERHKSLLEIQGCTKQHGYSYNGFIDCFDKACPDKKNERCRSLYRSFDDILPSNYLVKNEE